MKDNNSLFHSAVRVAGVLLRYASPRPQKNEELLLKKVLVFYLMIIVSGRKKGTLICGKRSVKRQSLFFAVPPMNVKKIILMLSKWMVKT